MFCKWRDEFVKRTIQFIFFILKCVLRLHINTFSSHLPSTVHESSKGSRRVFPSGLADRETIW
jgi:hypothetical protein